MKSVKMLSSDVSFVSENDLTNLIETASDNSGKYIIVTNTHNQYLAYVDKKFHKVHDEAHLRISDSSVLRILATLTGQKNLPKVMLGSDLMIFLCQLCEINNKKIGILGDTAENLIKLNKSLTQKFNKLEIAYIYSPPFRQLSKYENSKIITDINNSGVDILFVSLGCPKQEIWMNENCKKISALSFGVGAAFGFIANPSTDIPEKYHNLGLTWLFRLASNPKKLFKRYLANGLPFIFLFLLYKIIKKG